MDRKFWLPFILIVFLMLSFGSSVISAAYNLIENKGLSAGNIQDDLKEIKIKINNSRGVYKDGIIDNFDNFKTTEYPSEKSLSYTPS
ncbi:MAG: hypothetical protein ACPK85_05385 [Methanosarcina sp.]